MKNIIATLFFSSYITFASTQGVGMGTINPDPSAALEVSSVTQGMLVPRMSTAQREMIFSPAPGLLVYDLNTESFWFNSGSTWMQLIDSTKLLVHPTENGIYMGMDGNTGIGMNNPDNKVDIRGGLPRTVSHISSLPLYGNGTNPRNSHLCKVGELILLFF